MLNQLVRSYPRIYQDLIELIFCSADDEKSHVPTADQISRVFSEAQDEASAGDESGEEEQIEEIDFADVGKIQAEVDATAALLAAGQQPRAPAEASEVAVVEEKFTGFWVDTTPTPVARQTTSETVLVDRVNGVLGECPPDDEEIIVYVAPHPRTGRITPAPQQSLTHPIEEMQTTSVITGVEISETRREDIEISETREDVELVEPPASTAESPPGESSVAPPPPDFEAVSFSFEQTPRKRQTRKVFPVGGPRSLLQRSKKARRRSLRGFGAFGAMREEARLRERDPRESEQRRGDSDVNWGDSSDEGIEELSNGIGTMELDEGISLNAMRSFVQSMSADGSRHLTMDDVADMERIKAEDEEAAGKDEDSTAEDGQEDFSSSSEKEDDDDELERAVDAEERHLVGEDAGDAGDSEDEDEEESSDDEDTPRTSFQARLKKVRDRAYKRKADAEDGDSSDEAMSVQMTRRDEDDAFFAEIEVSYMGHSETWLAKRYAGIA